MIEIIISLNKNGSLTADVYFEGWAEGIAPDGFRITKKGYSKDQLMIDMGKDYPGAAIMDGVTGYCNECGEQYFELESECVNCGIPLSE